MQHSEGKNGPPYTMEVADVELVRFAVTGDGAAFEAIMRRHNQRLFRTARGIVTNDVEAEDIAQEAWMLAWRALPSFRADSKLATWLVRIVVNVALGRIRRNSAQIIPLESAMRSRDQQTQSALTQTPDQGPEQSVQRSQVRALIEARIDQLPQAFRSVFMLRAIEEMSADEVSEVLQIPVATVRTRYFRARALLRDALAQEIDIATGEAFSFAGDRCDRIVMKVMARARAAGLLKGH
ncbi:MAG: RNA polymerase sigma factor [Parvularcula sp.]